MNTTKPLRVVVCGTTFGQIYLSAFQREGIPLELVGILAQGSARSLNCARRFDIPLFTHLEQLPPETEAACVVVRSGVMGGRGTELSQALMERGLHVLQEHPLHYNELKDCLVQAKHYNVCYRVNAFYPWLTPVQHFIRAARKLLACRRALFIDAACAIQVAYPLFDILGQVFGSLRPWDFHALPLDRTSVFRSLTGSLAGLPLTLRVQNQVDPSDPDNQPHLLHRITLGTDGGTLTLLDSHGPVIFQPALHLPASLRDDFDLAIYPAGHIDFTSTSFLNSKENKTFRDIFGEMWPLGVQAALCDWHDAIRHNQDPRKLGQYQLSLCRIWQDMTSVLGYPEMLQQAIPRPLSGEALGGRTGGSDETNFTG